MTRAVLFDVDGVLVHGYHAKPEKQIRWDENLLADLGIDPDVFRKEFIYDIFVKKVIVGQMSLLEALDRTLPRLGYRGPSMAFAGYWLSHDSNVNQPLLDVVGKLKARGDSRLYVATNQEHMRAQWLWQQLKFGDVFEDMFHSARVGATKPHKPYFDWVSNRIGPQAEPPLFFDDSEDVVKGARAYGWEAVQYDNLEDVTRHPWIASRLA
ncbi:HAD-IA family hydrolase [Devosia sp. CN2-171]|uniref:HAD-IA family hydrolase n=1 Tax=Devosia sp. CN2-171 TaxID=3400909 RepID=UPI003BF7AE63